MVDLLARQKKKPIHHHLQLEPGPVLELGYC
jgi:hypothetical protein